MSDSSYLNLNGLKTLVNNVKSYTDSKVAGIVDSAPETLNTLNELSQALGDDENFATTIATEIGTKASQSDLDSLTTTVNQILGMIYPVGSVYISVLNKSPSTIFGGTWELIGQNRMLIGAGDMYGAEQTGGSTTHTHDVAMRFASYYSSMVMEGHEKTGIVAYAEDGTKTATGNTRIGYTGENNLVNAGTEAGRTDIGSFGVYETVGNTSYESSLPPYLAVYMWKRTA